MSSRNSPADQLLSERRKYKKNFYNLQSSKNHLSFLQRCHNYKIIPKGLRLKISCVALASQETTVQQEFKNTIERAERELINNLIQHYKKIETSYEEKLQNNMDKINEIKHTANPTTLFYHNTVMQSTKRNVENIIKKKQNITENKLDNLYFEKNRHRRPRELAVTRPVQNNQEGNDNSPYVPVNTEIANNNEQINIPIPSITATATEGTPATQSGHNNTINTTNPVPRIHTSTPTSTLINNISTSNNNNPTNSIAGPTFNTATITTTGHTQRADTFSTPDHHRANYIYPRTLTPTYTNVTTAIAGTVIQTPEALTPVTTNKVPLGDLYRIWNLPNQLPTVVTTIATPPPPGHEYAIRTRSRTRQQQNPRK